jgi:hypothetical protein
MIPEFDANGCLPPGVHVASLDEVQARFGSGSEVRQAQMESLRWFLEAIRPYAVDRIVLNGSFVTAAPEPNDVDVAVLLRRPLGISEEQEEQLIRGFAFLHVQIFGRSVFDEFVDVVFANDRFGQTKGMIEVRPWN